MSSVLAELQKSDSKFTFENHQKSVQKVGAAVFRNNSDYMYYMMFTVFLLKMVLVLALYRPVEVWS